MTLNDLVRQSRLRAHATSRQELESIRALVRRDLRDAEIAGLSADRRFATAYNAALQLCKLALACAGYRAASMPGHHQTTFEAAEIALGKAGAGFGACFDTCRRKRNIVDYDAANVVAETETAELVKKAREFQDVVEAWIATHHPGLTP